MKLDIDWTKQLGEEWYSIPAVRNFVNSPYMISLIVSIIKDSSEKTIYPPKQDVFKAFRLCSPKDLKVVILGQDPYHDGSATGLAFSNPANKLSMSPSLKQIWNACESATDTIAIDFDQTLESWAQQGVLLLNTALTVEKGRPNSHADRWKKFTDFIIRYISANHQATIFLLWGRHAQAFKNVDKDLEKNCHVLEAEHPVAASYRGEKWKCNHFKRVNEIITGMNGKGFDIKW